MGHLYRLLGQAHVRRLAWLALLGPLFFLTYNLANSFAASREPGVPSILFDWERHIPFLAWTIVPYWSSDLLYAASFWWCRTAAEIDRHGRRLVAIQLISVSFFALFPLKLTRLAPVFDGFLHDLYAVLTSFDKPYNEAPSLHISLAYILWRQIGGVWAGAWFLLIGLSTLTTWQHHFIDIPTGLWAGVLVTVLWPDRARPECRVPRLAVAYGLGSAAFTVGAFYGYWLLLWPAFSLSMVAAAYATGNVETLGKKDGRMPLWMLPYWVFAQLNSRLWNTGKSEICDGVWVGRPLPDGFRSVVDLTGELPMRADVCVPMLDLAPPSCEQIERAVAAIEERGASRPTLVCCALGYSRSAAAVAAWLVATGRAASVGEAVAVVRSKRPRVVLHSAMLERLEWWHATRG